MTAGNVSPEASDDDDEGGGDRGSDLMIRPGGDEHCFELLNLLLHVSIKS